MSDRTYCQMYVKDLPNIGAAALVAAAFFDEEGHGGAELTEEGQVLLDGECLTIEEIPCGYSEDLFAKVIAIIQELGLEETVRVRLWEDPKYEWLGMVHIHIPGLHDWHNDCDGGGEPVITTAAIVGALKDYEKHPAGLASWLRSHAGTPWSEAWDR